MSIVLELKQQIADLQAKIENIQEECAHPRLAIKERHASYTGNYDPQSDCYWAAVDKHCGLCDKSWREDR